MYALFVDGYRITGYMTLEVLVQTFGSIKSLETRGIRVIKGE